PPAAEKLLAYSWPGNVRELQNCIERAIALTQHERIGVEDLPETVRAYKRSHVLIATDDPSELVPLAEVERRYVLRVLEAVGGNKTAAAPILGVTRRAVHGRLEERGAARVRKEGYPTPPSRSWPPSDASWPRRSGGPRRARTSRRRF